MSQILWKNIAPFALLIGLAATGCGAQGPDTESESAAQAKDAVTTPGATQATQAAGHMRGHGGPEMIFRAALSDLDLTADQKTKINGLIDGLHPAAPPAPPAVFGALADQVRAGKVDETELQSKIALIKPDAAAGPAKMAASIQALHDTLTADQRSKLVASIEAKMAAHEAEETARHADHEGRGHDGKHGGAPFLHGIDLTDAQRTQIEQALANAGLDKGEGKDRFADMKARAKAALDAFPADKFDATAFMPPAGEGPDGHAAKLVKAMAIVVPLLDETQRAQLADNLAKGPFGHGGPMNHEPPPDAP